MISLSYLRRMLSANARTQVVTSLKKVAAKSNDRHWQLETLEDRCTPATVTWIGFGDGVNWKDASNWDSSPALPGSTDDVIISSGVTGGTVVYSSTAPAVTTVNSVTTTAGINLSFTGGTLNILAGLTDSGTLGVTGGTVNVTGASSVTGAITASSGTFAATGALTAGSNLTASGAAVTLTGGGSVAGNYSATGGTTTIGNTTTITGTATLNGGDVSGSGNVTVTGLTTLTSGTMGTGGSWTANGGTTINPGSSYSINGRTYVMNGGTNTWSSGDIFLSNAAVFRVATGQTLTTTVNRTIGRLPASGSPSVDIQGTFTKSTGVASTVIDTSVAFNINGGIVNVNTGTLQLKGGGTATGAGALNGAATTTIDFNSGTYTFASTTSIAGAGSATYSGGTVTVNGTYNLTGGFTVSGGSVTMGATATVTSIGTTLNVSGGTATFNEGAGLTVTTFNLTGGTASFGATAPLTVTTFTQNGSSQLQGAGSVTVSGVTTFSAGTQTGTGTTQANGTLTLDTANSKTLDGGRILNVAATGTWSGGTIFVNNSSQLVVQGTGTLSATTNDAVQRTGGTGTVSVAGIFNKNTGTGVTLIDTGVSLANTGTVNVNAGTLRLAGGGSNSNIIVIAASSTLDFNGGTFTTTGASNISGAGTALYSGATVTINGTYNVTGGFNVTGGSVTLAAGATVTSIGTTLNVSGGSATFNEGSALTVTTFNLSGGTATFSATTPLSVTTFTQTGVSQLAGAGNVTVSGVTTFSSGTQTGTGITQANGTINIDTTNSKTLDGGRVLNIAATGTWSGGTIQINNSSSLVVQGTGTLNATSNDQILRTAGSGTFSNSGIFNKNTGSGITKIDTSVTFTNAGTTNVNAGTLQIAGGGTSAGPVNLATSTTLDFNGGSFNIAGALTGTGTAAVLNSGATTTVDGTYSLSATGSTTVTGGTLTLNAASTVTPATGLGGTVAASNGTGNFNNGEAVTITTINLTSNGNLNFGAATDATVTTYNQSGTTQLGGVGSVTVSGVTTFTSGTMTGAGLTTANGALNIGGGTSVSITGGRTVTANATGTWSSSDIILDSGGILAIGAAGSLNATGDNSIKRFTFSGTGTVNNAGTFAKTGGAGNTTIDTSVSFNNTNIVNVNSGTFLQQGLGTNSGTFNVAATKELRYNGGTYAHSGTSSVLGAGTVRFSGGTVTFDGIYNVTGNITDDGGTATFNPASTVVAIGPTLNVTTFPGVLTFNNGEAITIVTLNIGATGGGTVNFTGSSPATVTTLNMSNGTLAGTSTVTVSGVTTWTGGTMGSTGGASGTTQLNGAATINGTSSVSLNNRLLNIGANSTWSGGQIFADNGTVLTVQATFTLTITGNNNYSRNFGTGTSSIVVAATGLLVKSTGVGSTTVDNFTTVTNNGTIRVTTGTLDLAGGLTNFAGSTLTGGIYDITGVFKFASANIITNSATITLNTSTSDIQTSGGGAGTGLANFATNSTTGIFTETGNKSLTVPGSFTNSGLFTLGVGSSFLTAAGTYANNNVAAITTVNGTLDPFSTVTISAGTLNGTGTVQSNTLVNGTGNVAPGTSPGVLNVVGNIVFLGSSTLTMEVNGLTVGTQYDQLNVTGTVTLTSVTLVTSGTISTTFGNSVTIINNDLADNVTGTFTGLPNNSNITINGQNFVIAYNNGDNDVRLIRDTAPTSVALNPAIATSFSPVSVLVGNLTTVDPDVPPDTITYSMINDAGGRFALSGSTIVVGASGPTLLDSTVNATHNITVRATDSLGAFVDQVITITVVPRLRVNTVGPVTTPTNVNVDNVNVALNVLANLPLAANFDFNDLTLTLNAGPNLITGAVTVTFVSGTTYQISGLSGLDNVDGTYVLTVDATGVNDAQGVAGVASGTNSVTWVRDSVAPTITSVQVISPDPRNTSVTSWDVTFSELINIATLTSADFTFDAGGPNLLTGSETISFVSGTTYRISGLPAQTVDGTYMLTAIATGVQDLAGNAGTGPNGVDSFVRDATGPTITSVEVVTPDPRNTQVTTWDVTFSETVNIATLTSADFTFTAGGPNLLTGSETISFVSGTTYRISGLPAQTVDGAYTLTVIATGIQDPVGNAGTGPNGTDSFVRDTVGPTITTVEVISPDPRNTQVTTWDVTFSETVNIATLTSADFTFTAGGPNLLTGSETVSFVSGTTYRISGLPAQSSDGGYTLTVDPTGVQDATGNAGTGPNGTDSFVRDTTSPIVVSVEIISPDPRATQVTTWDVTLSEVINLATMTSADFRLFQPGPTNILTGAETVSFVSGTTYRISGLPAQTINGIHQLNIVLFGVQDLAGNSGANIGVDTWTYSTDVTAPTITGLYFAGSTWSAAFNTAAGDATYGFPASTGASQFASMPWSNLNRAYVTFSEPVQALVGSDIRINRLTGGLLNQGTDYTFALNGTNDVLTITFLANLGTDKYLIDLDGDGGASAIQDIAGNFLAGTWNEGVSTFPTTGAAAQDFQFRYVVGVGDVNRNGQVRNNDVNQVRAQLFNDLPSGTFDIFSDMNGDGLIRNADVNTVRANLFNDPPTGGGPARPVRGPGASRNPRTVNGGLTFATSQVGTSDNSHTTVRRLGSIAHANVLDQLFAEI